MKFGNATDPDATFYNFQAARMNYYFDQSVHEYSDAVKKANDLLPNTQPFEVSPINIHFEKGKKMDERSAFYRNGHDKSKVADIMVGDSSNKKFETSRLMHNIIHEWSHWNLYRYVGATRGSYNGYYSYNENTEISFKEGWALFIGDLYVFNYDSVQDENVQTDNKDGVNRLFGKSTNYTVMQVLFDLVDTASNDEDFSISQRYLEDGMSDLEIRRLNLGILHTVMAESKTVTLQDLLKAIEKKYVLTKVDKTKFAKLLEVNELSRDGALTSTIVGIHCRNEIEQLTMFLI